MFAQESLTLNFYDAVMANDVLTVKKTLNDIILGKLTIPVRILTGILVIALENDLLEVANEIILYNDMARDKITNKHLDAVLCMASKLRLLEKLNVTFH